MAAYADHHLMVSKRRNAAGTTSTVTPVLGDLRVAEVARMLGGERPTGTSLAHASEMLSLASTPQKG
ncbi:MAG: DNA repair protein RecN [uncultured bacterium]|nr:MAG: DNA repair protein RecN [uncultured bacterium]